MTRKEQLQEIEERLKNGVEEYFTSEKYASLLRIMSKFYNYSFNNCILIATQCPQACQNRKKQIRKRKILYFCFHTEKNEEENTTIPVFNYSVILYLYHLFSLYT